MSSTRSWQVEQDDFLAPAPLFRYGPRALMLVGMILCASVLLAALWRIELSRKGEYEKAFDSAAAYAAAVHASLSQLHSMLDLTTATIGLLQNSPEPATALSRYLDSSKVLRDNGIRAIVIDASGQVIAASPGSPMEPDWKRRLIATPPVAEQGKITFLPAKPADLGSEHSLWVLHPSAKGASGSSVLYLVDTDALTTVFQDMLAGKAAWLLLENPLGQPVAETHSRINHALTDGTAVDAAARNPNQAMEGSVNYESTRLLMATKKTDTLPLKISVGLVEGDVLRDLNQRVSATWLIFGVSMLVVMSLVTITSIALRKFAVKERHLRRLATVDILTGLPNRRSFHHLLATAVEHADKTKQVFGLMFVDLDNFKDVNDSLGHEAGDALLQRVGQLLGQAVRQGDRVCRLGGDEFTVLLNDLSGADQALEVGQRMLDILARPVRINDIEVRARATIGVALMPQHASTMSDLMRFADTAMYRAKKDGKSICLIYDDSMAVQALSKAKRAQELSHAIANDELILEYQPKFCAQSGRITGLEALVRWQHPQRGLIGPAQFIALAEEAGLIIDLGQWVLERAVRQLRQWHDDGGGWQHVAINVSALQLRSGRFPACVQAALVQHGVPGPHLQLELTESSLVLDTEQARALVRQMHSLGGSVAVDDFGTGYSSLAALQQFDIDYLKIDRAFVSAIETHSGTEICRAVVNLAHGLKMRAVAEGVETEVQRDILQRLGCDELQGFLFARPMPANDVLDWTRRTSRLGFAHKPPRAVTEPEAAAC